MKENMNPTKKFKKECVIEITTKEMDKVISSIKEYLRKKN
tara:strand:- start:512 stop:631 length:120 start_codon:yes stop_codon:yes gene_type:complete